MSYKNLILSFQGEHGQAQGSLCKTTVTGIVDTEVATFKTFLDAHTDAAMIAATVSETTETGVARPSNGSNTDRRLVCFLRDATNGKTVKITLFAPLAADLEMTPDGERATATFMTSLAASLGTLKGVVLTPLYGYVKQVQ